MLTQQEIQAMWACAKDDPPCINPGHRLRPAADALVLRGLLRPLANCDATFELTGAGYREFYGVDR